MAMAMAATVITFLAAAATRAAPFATAPTFSAAGRRRAASAFVPPPSEGGGVLRPPERDPSRRRPQSLALRAQKDVRIRSVDDVPALPADAVVDVYYVEQAIQALGTIGEVVEAYHAGLVFEPRGRGDSSPAEFTIEWYALNFPFGAFLPDVSEVDGGGSAEDPDPDADPPTGSSRIGIKWANEAHPHYSPVYDPDRWSKGKAIVGSIDGGGFAEYVKFVVDYDRRRPGYQAFEVWDRPELVPNKTKRWARSETCSTFVEESLRELYRLGGRGAEDMIESRQLLERSYAPLVARRKPQKVDLSDPDQAQEVRDFYVELNKAARGVDGEGLSTSDFVRLLADRLEVFYIYDTPRDEYYRVELKAPYFALSNLYQPMSLPWQLLDLEGDGGLEDPGAFAPEGTGMEEEIGGSFLEELSSTAASVGGLLRRRLPPVLMRRFAPKVVVPIGLGLVVAGAAILGPERDAVDGSFVAGVLVGIAVGAAGSRALSEAAED